MAERQAPIWWGIPKRFSERGKERKISWLELFYDLVYAGAVSQLTGYLSKNMTLAGLGYMLFMFMLIYWGWLNGSMYHDLHGNRGVRSRLTTLWQMMAVASIAVTITDAFEGRHQAFAVSFSMLQLLITYLWWSTGYYDPAHKLLNRFYVLNYFISFLLFVISVFVPYHIAQILWAIALFFNLTSGVFSVASTQREMLRRGEALSASDSMLERFGLFTIIVLGEAILGIIHGISACPDQSMRTWLSFMLSMVVAFLIWWIYFDMLGDSKARKGYPIYLLITFVYIPLLGSFAVLGSAIQVMLSDGLVASNTFARLIFGVAIAVILFTTVALSYLMKRDEAEAKAVSKILGVISFVSLLVMIIALSGRLLILPVYLALVGAALLIGIVSSFRIWMGFNLFTQD
jgi:low temperature requirement protein LtrA